MTQSHTHKRLVLAAAIVAGASAVVVTIAITFEGLIGDASVILSLFLGVVAMGLAAAGFGEWLSGGGFRSIRRRRDHRRRGHVGSMRCVGCGSPLGLRDGIRVCPACDTMSVR